VEGVSEDPLEPWSQPVLETIPPFLGELTSLQRLHLQFPGVRDTDLPFLGSLTALRELHLDLPSLTTLQSLVSLTSLEQLHLKCPHLETLLECGDKLSKLTEVSVTASRILKPLSARAAQCAA